jgi:hypothetical protein
MPLGPSDAQNRHGRIRSGPSRHNDLESIRSKVLQNPLQLRFLDYWCDLRRGRPMPARADIDPTDIPWALSCIYLIDYLPATREFRYRLAGEEICRNFERASLRGLELAEIMPPEVSAYVRNRWLSLIDPPSLLAMRGLIYFAMDKVQRGERLMMPLSDSGDGQATGLLGMTVSEWNYDSETLERSTCTPRDRVTAEVNFLPVAEIP